MRNPSLVASALEEAIDKRAARFMSVVEGAVSDARVSNTKLARGQRMRTLCMALEEAVASWKADSADLAEAASLVLTRTEGL